MAIVETYAMTTGYYTQVEKEKTPSLLARDYKDPTVVNDKEDESADYRVRRLTPTECARLQGFPDWWCSDLGTEDPAEEEIVFWTDVFELMTNINNYVKKAFADPDNNATDILKMVIDPWMEKKADRIGVVYSVDNGSSSWGDQFTIHVNGEILFGKQGSSWKDLGYTDVDTAKQLCDVYEKYCTDYNSHFVNQEWANGAYERYQIKPGNKGSNSVQTFGSMMRVVMYVTSSLNNIDVQFSRAAHSTIGLLEKAINHPAAEES